MAAHAALRGIVVCGALALGFSSAFAAVNPGDPAPDFTLVDTNGASHTLSDYRGKVVLLAFIGNRCGFCMRAAPDVEAIWQQKKNSGLQVLAVDFWNGNIRLVRDYIIVTRATYPVLREGGDLEPQYGLPYSSYVVVDPDGIVRYTSRNEPYTSVGYWNNAAVQAAVDAWLPTTAVQSQTWSAVKALVR